MADLIDRNSATDSIEKHLRSVDELYPLTETDRIMNHAFEIAASCVYNLPSAQPEPRWIPVSEPPEFPGRFICYYEVEEFGEVGHCIDFGRYDEDDGWYVSGVKYWMPLPDEPDEPYERSEDE